MGIEILTKSAFRPSGLVFATLAVALFASGCDKTPSASSASTGGQFSNDQLLTSLRGVSLRTRLALPDPADVDALSRSTDPEAAYALYSAAVDRYVMSAEFAGAMRIYYRQVFGMAAATGATDDDAPINLAIYIIMNDKPYSELLTANYKLVNDLPLTGQDSGTPLEGLGGFATLKSWLDFWYGNGFGFNYIREIARITECYKYPPTAGSEEASGAWTLAALHPKYDEDPVTKFACHECHRTLNVRRQVFLAYGNNGTYNTGRDWTDAEPALPAGEIEPRNSEEVGFTRPFALDSNDKPMVGDFMKQITETASFKECTARRFLSFALGYESAGVAGNNLVLPFDFKASDRSGDIELLAKWKGKMENESRLVIRDFLATFFKDPDFIYRAGGVGS